jgi:hypothetical protein
VPSFVIGTRLGITATSLGVAFVTKENRNKLLNNILLLNYLEKNKTRKGKEEKEDKRKIRKENGQKIK